MIPVGRRIRPWTSIWPNIKDWEDVRASGRPRFDRWFPRSTIRSTTTDEARSPPARRSSVPLNPLGLAEFTLSRKDPAYVGWQRRFRRRRRRWKREKIRWRQKKSWFRSWSRLGRSFRRQRKEALALAQRSSAVKPGDGSAREQAASCQKVLGGWANIANRICDKALPFQPDLTGACSRL